MCTGRGESEGGGLRQGRYAGGDRSREQTNKQTNLAQADAQCKTVTTEHRGIGVVRHIDDDPTPVRASAASLGKNGNLYLFPEIFPEIKQSNARNGKRKFGSPAAEFSVKPKVRLTRHSWLRGFHAVSLSDTTNITFT
jgi:hypothetical protein